MLAPPPLVMSVTVWLAVEASVVVVRAGGCCGRHARGWPCVAGVAVVVVVVAARAPPGGDGLPVRCAVGVGVVEEDGLCV